MLLLAEISRFPSFTFRGAGRRVSQIPHPFALEVHARASVITKEVWRCRTGQNLELERRADKVELADNAWSAAPNVEGINIGVQRQCIDLNVNSVCSCPRQGWTVGLFLKITVVS